MTQTQTTRTAEYLEQLVQDQMCIINTLRKELAWRDALDASPKFDASTKTFIVKQAKAEQREKPNDAGQYRIDMHGRASEMGMSPSAPSRKAALLAENGYLETDGPVPYIKKNGDEVPLVFGRLAPELKTAEGILGLDDTKLRPWGGDHYVCLSCGGRVKRKKKTLVEQEIVTCTECGEVTVYPPQVVAEADMRYKKEPEQLVPGKKNLQHLPVNTLVHTVEQVVPDELKAYPNFVVWCYKGKPNSKGKIPKVPHDPKVTDRAKQAMPNNPSTWGTVEQAQKLLEQVVPGTFDGIGYVFSKDDPFAGIDKDDCRDPDTGVIDERGLEMMRQFPTRWEVSPSGKGIKGIMKGSIPHGINRQGVELYSSDHFFTLTGQHVPGTPQTIEDCNTALNALYRKLAPEEFTPPNTEHVRYITSTRTDEQILELAKNARDGSGETFWRLWNGIIPNYPSQSEADLALCGMLGYWTDNNVFTIDRLFRKSRLYRDKWDEKHGSQTYGEKTIQKAIGRNQERIAS